MKYVCVVRCDGTGACKKTGIGVATAVVGVVTLEPKNFDQDLLLSSWKLSSAHSEVYRNLTVPQIEYSSVLLGLNSCRSLLLICDSLIVYTDSQLVANQISGSYACRNSGLKPYLSQIKHECDCIETKYSIVPRIEWVEREFNVVADNIASVVKRHALEVELLCSSEVSMTTR